MQPMRVSDRAIAYIKQWEGFRTKAYRCVAGYWTIGYGHTTAAGPPAVRRGLVITEAEAEATLRRDLRMFEKGVLERCKRLPNQNQFDAMVSLSFNVGLGNYENSTCLRRFNAGNYAGAAQALQWFNKANGRVFKALVRRRKREAQWFLETPAENPPPADYVREAVKEPLAPTHMPMAFLPFVIAAVLAAVVVGFVWIRKRFWK